MRILWHSLVALDDEFGAYRDLLSEYLEEVARDETTIDLRGVTYGTGDVYASFETLDEAEVVRNLLALREDDEIDAVAVGNTFDPGVHQVREILDIPVLGIFETALLASHTMADRFAVIADAARICPALRTQVREYGLGARVTGVYGPEFSLDYIGEAFEDEAVRQEYVAAFEDCVSEAVEEGADLVIPGGGLVPILFHHMEGIREMHGVPILDKTAVLLKLTEAMVDLYEAGYAQTSRSGAYASPPPEHLDDLAERYEI